MRGQGPRLHRPGPLGNVGIKTGGATGGSTLLMGATSIASGLSDCTLVLGWERMDEVITWTGNFYIASAACKDFETRLARNYASYYAPMADGFKRCTASMNASVPRSPSRTDSTPATRLFPATGTAHDRGSLER